MVICVASACAADPTPPTDFTVVESNIRDLQRMMSAGQLTSRQVVEAYLVRMALYEDRLNAAVAVNANALAEADALDAERAAGRVRGPMHGIPVALKDNIHTTHLPTTGGALAFDGYVPRTRRRLPEISGKPERSSSPRRGSPSLPTSWPARPTRCRATTTG